MGNAHSQSDTTRKDTVPWSNEQRTQLKHQHEKLQSKGLASLLPASPNQAEIVSTFEHILTSSPSFERWVQTADTLNRDSGLSMYKAAYKIHQCSVETWIEWLVCMSVRVWYQGSGRTWPLESHVNEDGHMELAHYLLYREQERRRDAQRQKEEDLAFLDPSYQHAPHEDAFRKEATAQQHQDLDNFFTQLATDAPDLVTLHRALVQYLFFGRLQLPDAQARQAGALAPPLADTSRLLTPYDYYMLTRQLPADALDQHERIYNSATDGASWQVFLSSVLNRGATLLVLKTREGHVLGGYADAPWLPVTDWYGDTANALFRCGRFSRSQETLPMNAWRATMANDHYQYLCWGKKSLPNGLAMGGQFGYCGLWLDQDFQHGHSKAGPLCTTYQSPALVPSDEFMLEEAEVWLVRPRPPGEDEDEAAGGGMFSRAENMEFMEMAGRKMYSKDLPNQPVESQEEKSSE